VWGQSRRGHHIGRRRDLELARFDEHATARSKPLPCLGRDPPGDVQPIATAVEGHDWFVQPRLGRQQRDLLGRYIRHIGDEDVDASTKTVGQGLEEISLIHESIAERDVASRACDGGRLDVGRVQLDPIESRGDGGTKSARPTAQIENNGGTAGVPDAAGELDGQAHQNFGTAAGHKDARPDRDPEAGERGPADDLLERKAGNAGFDHTVEVGAGGRRGQQDLGLVLGKDAAGRAKGSDDPRGLRAIRSTRRVGHLAGWVLDHSGPFARATPTDLGGRVDTRARASVRMETLPVRGTEEATVTTRIVSSTVELRGIQFGYAEQGDGPVALYAHGLTLSRANDEIMGLISLGPIADAGFRVIAYDARGHGQTTGTADPAGYTWDSLADDLLALADHFSPDAPVAVMGASMGTGTILHAAVRRPDRLSELVLTAPPTAWDTRTGQTEVYEQMSALAETTSADALATLLSRLPEPPIFADVPAFPPPAIAHELLPSVLRGAARSDLPGPAALATITAPTLILAWTTDPGHPVTTAERLADLIPGSELHVSETSADIRTWGSRAAAFLAARRDRPAR
jgi:3-oxoadipate enol-lactonase